MSVSLAAAVPGVPPPAVAIEPTKHLFHFKLADVWHHRELLYFLVWRDVKVRYKQTAIGVVWVVLQPLLTMAIFAAVLGRLVKIPSDNVPYPLFVFVGLLPWLYFSSAISRCGASLVAEADVIRKVYFPRLIIPLSAVLGTLVDLAIGLVILIPLIYWYGLAPTRAIVTLPFFTLLALVAALAVGLWLAALNVRYRDVGHAIPFLTQCWMYASPVVYPVSLLRQAGLSGKLMLLYGLNPVVGVLSGYRWALLAADRPEIGPLAGSVAIVLLLLTGGLVFFKYMERSFVDVI
jgi:lipopolysaccharide transport system permease protein